MMLRAVSVTAPFGATRLLHLHRRIKPLSVAARYYFLVYGSFERSGKKLTKHNQMNTSDGGRTSTILQSRALSTAAASSSLHDSASEQIEKRTTLIVPVATHDVITTSGTLWARSVNTTDAKPIDVKKILNTWPHPIIREVINSSTSRISASEHFQKVARETYFIDECTDDFQYSF